MVKWPYGTVTAEREAYGVGTEIGRTTSNLA